MKSQIEECLEAEQAIFIVIGQAKERERSNFHSDGILVIGLDNMMVMMMVIIMD